MLCAGAVGALAVEVVGDGGELLEGGLEVFDEERAAFLEGGGGVDGIWGAQVCCDAKTGAFFQDGLGDGHRSHVCRTQEQIAETSLKIRVTLLERPHQYLQQSQLAGDDAIALRPCAEPDRLQEGAVRLTDLVTLNDSLGIQLNTAPPR